MNVRSPIKITMKNENDKTAIQKIKYFFKEYHRMPSYSEIATLMGFASKNAVFKLINRLVEAGVVEKDSGGRLSPCGFNFGIPLAGYVKAGFPSPAEEELIDTLSLDDYLINKPNSSFLLIVSGDSMIDAGINPDDLVIIERSTEAKNGDVVLAQVDRDWTLKYFRKHNDIIKLIPANKNYPEIIANEELKIAGIVKGLVRKY